MFYTMTLRRELHNSCLETELTHWANNVKKWNFTQTFTDDVFFFIGITEHILNKQLKLKTTTLIFFDRCIEYKHSRIIYNS